LTRATGGPNICYGGTGGGDLRKKILRKGAYDVMDRQKGGEKLP